MNALNSSEVLETAKNVILSAQVAYGPLSSAEDRQKAIAYLSLYRTAQSPQLQVAVALSILTDGSYSADLISQNFIGYQLMQYTVTYLWSQLDQDDRNTTKVRILDLFEAKKNVIANSPTFLKESLAKVLVEIAKKEWPQLWPEFIPFLKGLVGTEYQEITFLVLRRLCEDVFIVQNISNNARRRDLTQSLQLIAWDVLEILFGALNTSVAELVVQSTKASLIKLLLTCITAYCEFIDQNLLISNGRIALILSLLNNDYVKMEAADCLLQMLERKGTPKKDDKSLFVQLCLSNEAGLPLLQQCAANVIAAGDDDEEWNNKFDSLVVCISGASAPDTRGLDSLFKLLQLLASSANPCRVLTAITSANCFLRNSLKKISLNEQLMLKGYLIQLITTLIGYFLLPNTFGIQREDAGKTRYELSQLIRNIGRHDEKFYLVGSEVLHRVLTLKRDKQQLEFLVFLMDHFSTAVTSADEDVIFAGLNDLQFFGLLFLNETNLITKSILLSGISGNFRFLTLSRGVHSFGSQHNELLMKIVQSMLKCFEMDLNEVGARELRRHVTALFQKLTAKDSDVINIVSDYIVSTSSSLLASLTTFEYCGMIEVMLSMSNKWDDVEKQQTLLKSVVNHVNWVYFQQISGSVGAFTQMLTQQQGFEANKAVLVKSLSVLQSIVRRIRNRNIRDVVQSPALDLVQQILPGVFESIKAIHGLLEDPVLRKALDLRDVDENQIMGLPNKDSSSTSKDPSLYSQTEKIKNTVLTAYELCCNIIGESCTRLSSTIYSTKNFANIFLNYVCFNIEKLNNFRLRQVLRLTVKPFMISCPDDLFESTVKAFFQQFGPYLSQRLRTSWATLSQDGTSTEYVNDSNVANSVAETIDMAILRLLVKDYFDLLIKFMEIKSKLAVDGSDVNTTVNGNDFDDESEIQEEMEVDGGPPRTQNKTTILNEIGELGISLLADSICFNSIIPLCAIAINWNDSQVSLKAIRILNLAWNYIHENSEFEIVRNIFIECLKGAVIWMKNEANMDGIHKLVDKIISKFSTNPVISEILVSWGVSNEDVVKMQQLFHQSQSEKKRKDLFVKWTNNTLIRMQGQELKAQWLKGLPTVEYLLKGWQAVKPENENSADNVIQLQKLNFIDQDLNLAFLFS